MMPLLEKEGQLFIFYSLFKLKQLSNSRQRPLLKKRLRI